MNNFKKNLTMVIRSKIFTTILPCFLLIVCLSGCSMFNISGNNFESRGKTDYSKMELSEFFDMIKLDAAYNDKLKIYFEHEQLHYELKSSGLYENSEWREPGYIITVNCNYEYAVEEEWYKQCSEIDIKSLNSALYNHYKSNFQNGKYSNIFFNPGMYFEYFPQSEFPIDYDAFKTLTELEYVVQVNIVYYFSIPYDYMEE